jgi:Lysozyme like domain
MATLATLEIYTLARRAGFSRDRDQAVIATAIALAESGGDPRAHNSTPPDDSFGLWQINMLGKLGPERRRQFGITRNEELFDPLTNARAARSVFTTSKRGFKPWTTFTSGKHEMHLGAARQAAQQVEASGLTFGIEQEDDVTEAELREIVREEFKNVLDSQAKRVSGISSWERYLEELLKAARQH